MLAYFVLLLAFAFIDVCWCYGRTYYAVAETKTWSDAEAYCVSEYGGHLATITDSFDMADATTVRTNAGLIAQYVWVGLYDTTGDNKGWTWADGTTCEYVSSGDCSDDSYWYPGDPNYVWQKCAWLCIGQLSQLYWDSECSSKQSSLCSTGGTTYYGVNTDLSWTDAEAYCVANGGHLATITNSDEMAAVTEARNNAGIYSSNAWIGLYGTGDKNTGWLWVDGTSCDYVDTTGDCSDDDYWLDHPGDANDGCGQMLASKDVIDDRACHIEQKFICQDPGVSPPTSSPTTQPTECECETETECNGIDDYNIVFVLDESGSVTSSNYEMTLDFVQTLIVDDVNDDSQVAVIAFSNAQETLYSLLDTQTDDRVSVIEALEIEKDDANYAGRATDTLNAMIAGIDEIKESGDTTHNILILITDGTPNCGEGTDPNCDTNVCNDALISDIQDYGVTVVVIGVTDAFDSSEMSCLSSGIIEIDAYTDLDGFDF